MKANVGSYDSGMRFVAGCVLLIAANRGHGWGLAGFALVATAVGFCPVYWMLGIETGRCERTTRRAPRVDEPLLSTKRERRAASPRTHHHRPPRD
jgi:hypothetical protein